MWRFLFEATTCVDVVCSLPYWKFHSQIWVGSGLGRLSGGCSECVEPGASHKKEKQNIFYSDVSYWKVSYNALLINILDGEFMI